MCCRSGSGASVNLGAEGVTIKDACARRVPLLGKKRRRERDEGCGLAERGSVNRGQESERSHPQAWVGGRDEVHTCRRTGRTIKTSEVAIRKTT